MLGGPFTPGDASGDEGLAKVATTKKVTLSPQCYGSEMPVPISHPRYEFKTRLNRAMSVHTDQSDQSDSGTGRSAGGRSLPSDFLTMRSDASLKVRQGPVTHTEPITYHAYACYRHGSKQVHTQSIGYSSDADLVLHRRDVAVGSGTSGTGGKSVSPVTMQMQSTVEGALCLKPGAHPTEYNVDADANLADVKLRRRLRRLQKYPGVRCPKNRKIRNRLLNDHFATPAARRLYEAAHEDSDPDGLKQPAVPTFDHANVQQWMLHQEEDVIHANLQRLGLEMDEYSNLRTAKRAVVQSLDSGAFRFAQLPARMKSELNHAMTTDFMPGFIDDVESQIQRLIVADAEFRVVAEAGDRREPPPSSFDLACKDGYGRLVTHGVATFYKVASQSKTLADGQRVTTLTLPRKRVPLPDQSLLSYLRGERPAEAEPPTSSESEELRGGSDANEEERSQARLLLMKRRRFRRRAVVLRRMTNVSVAVTGAAAL